MQASAGLPLRPARQGEKRRLSLLASSAVREDKRSTRPVSPFLPSLPPTNVYISAFFARSPASRQATRWSTPVDVRLPGWEDQVDEKTGEDRLVPLVMRRSQLVTGLSGSRPAGPPRYALLDAPGKSEAASKATSRRQFRYNSLIYRRQAARPPSVPRLFPPCTFLSFLLSRRLIFVSLCSAPSL
jgi:hypothetical protein